MKKERSMHKDCKNYERLIPTSTKFYQVQCGIRNKFYLKLPRNYQKLQPHAYLVQWLESRQHSTIPWHVRNTQDQPHLGDRKAFEVWVQVDRMQTFHSPREGTTDYG